MGDLIMATPQERMDSFIRNIGQVPFELHHGIYMWLGYGVRPSGFLYSVIENDLRSAVSHADKTNLLTLPEIMRWFHNEAPSPCWGSREKALDWQDKGGVFGYDPA